MLFQPGQVAPADNVPRPDKPDAQFLMIVSAHFFN
jgi:hypothetical protein